MRDASVRPAPGPGARPAVRHRGARRIAGRPGGRRPGLHRLDGAGGRPGAPLLRPDRELRRSLGVDLGASPGTPVGSAGTGVVSFAGTVVDLLTVTVDHGGGLRTSYSYLGSVAVGVGAPVAPHTLIGTSGVDNGIEAVHFSVRVGAEYLDPEPWLRCLPPGPALSLTTDDLATAGAAPVPAVTAPYAGPGATRHPRRHVRPSPRRPSRRRRDRLPATRPGRGHPDAGRGPVAEGRPAGQRPRSTASP